MAMFDEKSEKKSLLITTIISVGIILLLVFFGLNYMDPPVEKGIAVNFGTSSVGSGNTQPEKPIKSAPKKKTTPQKSEAKPQTSEEKQEEKVVTQDKEEAPVIKDKKEKTETEEEPEENKEKKPKKSQAEDSKKEEKEKPEKEPEPKPDKSTSDALKNVLNGKKKDGESTEGEGNDQQDGDKGKENGDRNASSYYGQGKGLDGDGNYRLGGRKALTKKKYVQDCNESGTVVVEIKVNRQGKVIKASPGVKGTTNTSSCLLQPAKRAALDTKFNSDADAPSVQTGYIIYEFKLSD